MCNSLGSVRSRGLPQRIRNFLRLVGGHQIRTHFLTLCIELRIKQSTLASFLEKLASLVRWNIRRVLYLVWNMREHLLDNIEALCNTNAAKDVLMCCSISTSLQSIDYRYHTSITCLPLPRTHFNEKNEALKDMNSAAHQNPTISITSNCGNITDSCKNVWNNCDISIADEKSAVLEWLSPLEPRERHQTIGMNRMPGVGDWFLLTDEFTQWNQGDDGSTKPVLFCYGDPGVGKTYLRYGWRLPGKSAREAKYLK